MNAKEYLNRVRLCFLDCFGVLACSCFSLWFFISNTFKNGTDICFQGIKKLTELEKIYADVSRDGNITASDYMMIKNDIMDIKPIIQQEVIK